MKDLDTIIAWKVARKLYRMNPNTASMKIKLMYAIGDLEQIEK